MDVQCTVKLIYINPILLEKDVAADLVTSELAIVFSVFYIFHLTTGNHIRFNGETLLFDNTTEYKIQWFECLNKIATNNWIMVNYIKNNLTALLEIFFRKLHKNHFHLFPVAFIDFRISHINIDRICTSQFNLMCFIYSLLSVHVELKSHSSILAKHKYLLTWK